MAKIIIGVFILLHGLVHVLYVGHSLGLFDIASRLNWPERSWALAKALPVKSIKRMAAIFMLAAALLFLITGVGLIADRVWWRGVLIATIAVSSLGYLLFWNGKWQRLPDQGLIGVLINIAMLVLATFVQLPTI